MRNWTNSRHECQSLRYSCRSSVSGLLCSSGKITDAFARNSSISNVERASSWRVSVAFVKRWGSQVSWVLVVMARQSECTGPWRVMKKGNRKNWAKQLMLQFIVRQLGNNSHLQSEEQQKSSPRCYHREAMSNTSPLKPSIKRAYCPYNWYLTKKLRPP